MCTSSASKPARVERRRHLDLAVDALLAQDRDARPRAARDERRGHVVPGSKLRRCDRPGSAASCALRTPPRRTADRRASGACDRRSRDQAPRRSTAASSSISGAVCRCDPHAIAQSALPMSRGASRKPVVAEARQHRGSSRARAPAAPRRAPRRTAARAARIAAAGKCDARDRSGRRTPSPAASRTGRRRSGRGRRAAGRARAAPRRRRASCEQPLGSSRSARHRRRLAVDLRERATAEPVAPAAEIDQQQRVAPRSSCSAGVKRAAHVAHGRERGDDQRERRDHRALLALASPCACASTASPCRPESRCRAPDTAPRPPRAPSSYSAASSPGWPAAAIQLPTA